MVCSYNGVVSAIKNKRHTDACNNISETQKHCID